MSVLENYRFSDRDFNFIRNLVSERAGINLSDAKRQLVYSRLTRRLRELGLKDFRAYCSVLKEGDPSELVNFINAITTNLTAFFRESHHFEFLKKEFFPLIQKKNAQSRRVRIWSAGCSTGEEPYSIAITLMSHFPQLENWDVKILATDLDTNVLDKAKTGVYNSEKVEALPKSILQNWFLRGKGEHSNRVKVRSELKALIKFNHLNLMESWPFKAKFDLIFCRNVIIYFNKETQRKLVERYANQLSDNGHLLLGHSESLFKVSDQFELLGHTIYRKKA